MKVDIDVMTNHGSRFYGHIRQDITPELRQVDDHIEPVLTEELLTTLVKSHFPTLRQFTIAFN